MPLALGVEAARGLHNLSRAFSAQSRGRLQRFDHDQFDRNQLDRNQLDHNHRARRSLRARFGRDQAVIGRGRTAGPARTAPAAGSDLFLSRTDARLRASSSVVTRRDEDAGTTATVQRDRVDFRLRSSQIALGEDAVASIGEALAGRTEELGRVLDAAGLLGDFNSDFAGEFLNRISSALEDLTGEGGFSAGAASLDVKIRVRSESVRIENAAEGELIERSVQRIDIRVRFVALAESGEVEEPQGPLEADLQGAKGSLRGLGPLAQFDFNGDGAFNFDDVAALADEILA